MELLSEEERQSMEQMVSHKLEQMKSRALDWEPEEHTTLSNQAVPVRTIYYGVGHFPALLSGHVLDRMEDNETMLSNTFQMTSVVYYSALLGDGLYGLSSKAICSVMHRGLKPILSELSQEIDYLVLFKN